MTSIFDDQVNITVLQLEGYALPTVERKVVQSLIIHVIDVLSEHPEAAWEASINETLDVCKFTGTFALKLTDLDHPFSFHSSIPIMCEIAVIGIALTLAAFFEEPLTVLDRFFIGDYEVLLVCWHDYTTIVLGEGLHRLVQAVV